MKIKAQGAVLKEVILDNPIFKIVDFLIQGKEYRYTLLEIAEGTELDKVTIWRKMKLLIDEKLVINAGRVGNRDRFQINMNNPKTKIMEKMSKLIEELK